MVEGMEGMEGPGGGVVEGMEGMEGPGGGVVLRKNRPPLSAAVDCYGGAGREAQNVAHSRGLRCAGQARLRLLILARQTRELNSPEPQPSPGRGAGPPASALCAVASAV